MTCLRWISILFVCLCVIQSAAVADSFEPHFSGQQTVDGENAIAVTFSHPLDAKQDLSSYFSLKKKDGNDVDGAWILSEDPQVVYFTQIKPDTKYEIRIAPGLKSESGQTLAEEVAYEVKTRPVEPMIAFGSRGFVLASELVRGLPVDSLNIKQADIDFFRVKPGMTTEFKKNFWSTDYLYYYRSKNLQKIADLVYSGRWDLDIKKDLRTQVNIPITHIRELKTPGVYFAVLRGAGHYDYGYRTTWFTISDLGVHARVYERDIQFFIQSLKTAKAVQNAKIEGFDKKGNSLFSLSSDKSGRAVAKGKFDALSLVSVTQKDHISLLPMDVPELDLSEFETGSALFRPMELFAYGPRDLYRPGEIVVLDGILRDQDGRLNRAVPIRAKVIRPDGRMVREFTWKPGEKSHYHTSFQLPQNALTGKWRVEFTHGAGRLTPYPFVVSEFLPERMKLTIEDDAHKILAPESDLSIQVQGDFLYGAPAAGSRTNALVHIKPARELFKDKLPGYEFGSVQNLINTSYETDDTRLDDTGKGRIDVDNQWISVTSPHWVTANISLYDSGGRPVVRNASWQVWPAEKLVGIRNISGTKEDPDQVPYNDTAQFEVVMADSQGNLAGATGLKATVIREHREYYWEFKNGDWHWGSNSQFYTIDRFDLDIPDQGKASVDMPVKWGGYRLEIANPATGLTSSFDVWAGWRPQGKGQGAMNRPDRVDLTLNKKAYKAGDTAKVMVKAPEGGQGYLFVDGAENLFTLPISIPPEGKAFEIPIDPSWNRHDLHVAALIVRPGQSRNSKLPKRSVGLIPLPLDRSDRRLDVTILAPDKTEPNQVVEVAVELKSASATAPDAALVTLAAVDVGILNLSGFETPDPFGYFFQNRKYSPQLQDIYQKLIEAVDGGYAKQRFGGDAPSLTRGGDRPSTDVQIVAIHQKAVQTDDKGRAVFQLNIPDFDGRLRLMAVAHTDQEFGSSDREMILASPIVVQATMPRFLSNGDHSQVMLELHNLTDMHQSLTLETEIFGPISLKENLSGKIISLAPGDRSKISLPVIAGAARGRAQISCRVKGIKAEGGTRELVKSWFLETRSPYPPLTRNWKKMLAPGELFTLDRSALESLVSGTVAVQAGLGTDPPINLADHVSRLMAYPYGCLEQTVSGLFPHVLLSKDQFDKLGVASGTSEVTAKKISIGIQRLMEKQKSSGGFGLWSAKSPESPWLTAYATHFMAEANDAGYEVPESAVKKAIQRLTGYVRRPTTIPYPRYVKQNTVRAATRAYAAFVLARIGSLSLGDARSVYAYVDKHGIGPLGLAQAGVALGLAGDRHKAEQAFDKAIKTQRDSRMYGGDYGSSVRDFAAAYYYVSSYFPEYRYRALFLHELNAALAEREWLSTQERNSLVMAGAAKLSAPAGHWNADVTVGGETGVYAGDKIGQVVFTRGTAAKGFDVKNTGSSDLYIDLVLSGYPNTAPKPHSKGVQITRRFLDTKGKPMDISKVTSGDRVIVELVVKPEKQMPHALVVDMIPAGMELEDPNLSGAFIIDEVKVDKKTIQTWQQQYVTTHTEFRDDRFVAALELRSRQTCRIFYAARVVSPGQFKVPPSLVEDMYRPYIRGVGNTISQMMVTEPQPDK